MHKAVLYIKERPIVFGLLPLLVFIGAGFLFFSDGDPDLQTLTVKKGDFADEPTANLDRESSQTVMELFKELHHEGQTIIMVTHEEEYGKLAQKIVHLDDGVIVSITDNRHIAS